MRESVAFLADRFTRWEWVQVKLDRYTPYSRQIFQSKLVNRGNDILRNL